MIFEIDENYADVRFDKFLRKQYKDLPLSHIYNMIRKGKAKINGKKSKENYRLKIGDVLEINNDETRKTAYINLTPSEKEFVKNTIIYDENDIVMINKPSDKVVHKGSGHEYGMLEMLKAYYKAEDFAFVNRIDKSTSGVVLAGKTNKAVRLLSECMRNDEIEKYYYVKVKGKSKSKNFTIKNKLEKKEKKVEESDTGKESITEFKVIREDQKTSILEAKLITGRTHQIRVQLSEIKLPIIGDYKYGEKTGDIMCLFSHRIIIEKLNIDINLDIPKYF